MQFFSQFDVITPPPQTHKHTNTHTHTHTHTLFLTPNPSVYDLLMPGHPCLRRFARVAGPGMDRLRAPLPGPTRRAVLMIVEVYGW